VANPDGSHTVKIADFGLAKSEIDLRTRLGTPAFTAPEVLAEREEGYNNRCDYWSLGIVYYFLLTGKYPMHVTNMSEAFKTLCYQEFAAISLPSDVQVSECCKHFVRHHLFKNPDDRICDEEIKNHPFVMPTVQVMRLDKPVNSDDFLKPMVYDVELGDIYFSKAKTELGDKINEPHALKDFKPDPIVWGDVARVLGITDLDDMLVFTDGGICCKKDAPVEMKGVENIHALILSLKNGIKVEKMKVIEGRSLSDEDLQVMNTNVQKATVETLNQRLSVFGNFVKCCRENNRQSLVPVANSRFVCKIRSDVLKTDYLAKKLCDLQEDLCKKFDRFPKVKFCPPAVESGSPLNLSDNNDGLEAIDSIREDLMNLRNSAQGKVSSKAEDLTEELEQSTQLWQKHKGCLDETKEKLATVCESMNTVMACLQNDVEVMTHLVRYVDVLTNALTSTDVTAIYREMLPLVNCDCFTISEDDMKLLNEGGTQGPASAASAASADPDKESQK